MVDKFGVWKSILTCFKPRVLKSQMDFVDLDTWFIFKFSLFHNYAYSILCLNQVEILRQNEKAFQNLIAMNDKLVLMLNFALHIIGLNTVSSILF